MSVYYLDYKTVEIINRAFCGLGAGVRDQGGVFAVLARPQSDYFGVELFPSVFDKAAALLHGFVTTQYFFDGNKRTGFHRQRRPSLPGGGFHHQTPHLPLNE